MGQIALEIKQKIQERIKKGEKVADLSKQYGISEKTYTTASYERKTGIVHTRVQ
jgi:Mor family transcriptional regulator